MATLPGMVKAFAATDGREAKSIEHVARFIRERGYITNGKRGAGAPQMTVTDAANLLIALCGCDTVAEAPLAVDRFRSLRPWFAGTSDDFRKHLDRIGEAPAVLQRVSDCQTFGTALEVLIEGAAELAVDVHSIAASYMGTDDPEVAGLAIRSGIVGIEVKLSRYAAAIRLFQMPGGKKVALYESEYMVDTSRPPSFYGLHDEGPDRKVHVTIGLMTLLAAYRSACVIEEAEDD